MALEVIPLSPRAFPLIASILALATWWPLEASGQNDLPDDQVLKILRGRCRSGRKLVLYTSPSRSLRGQPVRVTAISEKARPNAVLVGRGPKKTIHRLRVMQRGGPPFWWFAQIDTPKAGAHRFALVDRKDGKILACGRHWVRPDRKLADLPQPQTGYWPVKRRWEWRTESLYAVWIEKLFDAPARTQPSWTPLHQVIRDPARNLLYNHLGTGEDGPKLRKAVVVKPDCADLPYFLRAYFAWKMRLPFGYRHCDRGNSRRAARCNELRTNLNLSPPGGNKLQRPAARFSFFLRRNVSYVHSGAGRTAPDDDETDLYPVALKRTSLKPGTVYVDPFGHLLIVARWVPQTKTRGGLLYAVDGHPDLSVGRKRFWKGAFLFSDQIKSGAGGFKAFRPLQRKEGQIVALTNDEINKHPDYRNHSAGQYRIGHEGFYDRMDQLINPTPLSPTRAYGERLEALYELILERVGSVKAGEDYMRKASYKTMKMPKGPRIFETRGPWEDFSTPARDMRLLIAFEEVLRYPQKVERQPKRFAMAPGQSPKEARKAMEQLFTSYTKRKTFSYTRSDGSPWALTMADLINRRKRLEIAYNPNDCVEIRWAAAGKELSTCRRHAPPDQLKLMEQYRSWFATRTRPPLR